MQKDTVINTISSVMLNSEQINKVKVIEGINETLINGQKLPVNGYLDIGLFDTMKDLFVDFIGAAVFSVFGYIYIRSEGRGKFINKFILRRKIHKRK